MCPRARALDPITNHEFAINANSIPVSCRYPLHIQGMRAERLPCRIAPIEELIAKTVNSQTTPEGLAHEVTDLVSLPDIYVKLRNLLNDPDHGLADIADVIKVDPGLTSRILRVANSALYGLSARVESIPLAVSLLGTQQIHDFVLATSVIRSFAGIPGEVVDMRKFWQCSVLCGSVSKILADMRGFLDHEHMFTVGLLAHVGRLVLYMRLPAEIEAAYTTAYREGIPLARALDARLGFTDADLAAQLLSAWNLPGSLIEPVRYSANLATEDTDTRFERACIVHVASAVADRDVLAMNPDGLVSGIDSAAWRCLGLNLESLQKTSMEAETLTNEIAAQFLIETT